MELVFAIRGISVLGIETSVKPQSKQATIFGNNNIFAEGAGHHAGYGVSKIARCVARRVKKDTQRVARDQPVDAIATLLSQRRRSLGVTGHPAAPIRG